MNYKDESFSKGFYHPIFPHKYKGKLPIVYRSSYEKVAFRLLEAMGNNLVEWTSESIPIPYISPLDNKIHRYFVDLSAKIKNDKTGEVIKYLIEIKPKKQVLRPVESNRKKPKTLLREQLTWAVNQAKFNAALQLCDKIGYKFQILTEEELGIQ